MFPTIFKIKSVVLFLATVHFIWLPVAIFSSVVVSYFNNKLLLSHMIFVKWNSFNVETVIRPKTNLV